MKLLDLDPQWLVRGGKRVGFTFISPVQHPPRVRSDGSISPTIWRQSCFAAPTPSDDQDALLESFTVQHCNPSAAWKIAGGIDIATFETITVTPSIDGSAGGLWHGFITNGEIK
jgi:hypothetical protein